MQNRNASLTTPAEIKKQISAIDLSPLGANAEPLRKTLDDIVANLEFIHSALQQQSAAAGRERSQRKSGL